MLDKSTRIFVAGHHGLVGSAIWNNLKQRGYDNLIGRSHKELDLLDPQAVKRFFDEEKPQAVVLAAAHVGGIMANLQYRADFIYQNLQIQQNVIGESWKHGVEKLLFLGSTCIYPGEAPQPMPEDCLLTSALEYTNEPYAIAKIAGLKMCESFNLQYGTNYIAVMPTNLYGPNDNFHLENSHVLPAMIRKVYLAKCLSEDDWAAVRKDIGLRPVTMKGTELRVDADSSEQDILTVLASYGIEKGRVTLWGTGAPMREFLWSEEMADASVHCLLNVDFKDVVEHRDEGQSRRHQGDSQLPHQRWHGQTTQHTRVCREDCEGDRIPRRPVLGQHQTRRHYAQTHRREQAAPAGLAPYHRDRRRHTPPL